MVKFKVGDKVRIRNLNRTQVDDYCEHTAIVKEVLPTGAIRLYSFPGSWRGYMLEKVEEEKKMKSKWAEVAAIFGLHLEEEFDIEDDAFNPYRFTERGLLDCGNEIQDGYAGLLIEGSRKIIKRPFKPKEGGKYWYVGDIGNVFSTRNSHWMHDYLYISSGNCYRTCEEAEAHVEEWKEKYRKFFND